MFNQLALIVVVFIFSFLDSPYRNDINQAILHLKESRFIKNIRDKWWITNNIPIRDGVPQNCTQESNESDALDISQMYGIFVTLAAGVGLALFAGIIEFLWNVRKVSVEQKVV